MLQEVVGHGPLRLDTLHFHGDGAGLRGSDPDGQDPLSVALLQQDHGAVGALIEAEVGHLYLDHRGATALR